MATNKAETSDEPLFSQEVLPSTSKSRGEWFKPADRELLKQLVVSVDPTKTLFSAKRDGGTRQKKAIMWQKVTHEFNKHSSRKANVTTSQLKRLMEKIRCETRAEADRRREKVERQIQKESSKTGGGKYIAPVDVAVDESTTEDNSEANIQESQEVTQVVVPTEGSVSCSFDSYVNNTEPLPSRFYSSESRESEDEQAITEDSNEMMSSQSANEKEVAKSCSSSSSTTQREEKQAQDKMQCFFVNENVRNSELHAKKLDLLSKQALFYSKGAEFFEKGIEFLNNLRSNSNQSTSPDNSKVKEA